MAESPKFRRNLIVVALAHVALVAALYLGGLFRPKPKFDEVMWLDGGSPGGGEPAEANSDPPLPPPPPEPEPEPPPPDPARTIESIKPPPPEPPDKADLVVPKATPAPTPKPTPSKPATPKPTPKSSTPKTTPKVTPRATAKPATKATPKASPKSNGNAKATPSAKPKGTPGSGKSETASKTPGSGPGPKSSGEGSGVGAGKGAGREGGGSRENEFSWYHLMIHDRFHARWEQPTSIVRSGADFVTTLKLRIGKDGTILDREIVNGSGNAVMDESVLTAANRVTQIDPLPKGLGNGEFYEIKVNFKLDQAQ